MKARNLVKHIVKAKNFNNIYNSTRQQKIKQLSCQHEVEWELTKDLLAITSVDGSTSFAQSGKKSFQVKCFTEELTTLVKLKRQRPDLYTSDWRCSTCGNEEETFDHVWLCEARREEVTSCIKIVQDNLKVAINKILKSPLTNEQDIRLCSAPTWSLIPNQDQFTFIETTKGVIHRNFVNLLTEFGCSYKQASSVIISALSGLVDLLQKIVWRARCDDQIQAELIHGIDQQSKRRPPPRSNSDPNSLNENANVQVNPNTQANTRSSIVNDEWYIWVNDVCHYGGNFINYVIHS
jgi:hypothetical protein